jgi:hypothetical protein
MRAVVIDQEYAPDHTRSLTVADNAGCHKGAHEIGRRTSLRGWHGFQQGRECHYGCIGYGSRFHLSSPLNIKYRAY